jgi:hypothetical protein
MPQLIIIRLGVRGPILALLSMVFFTLSFRNDTIAMIEDSDLDLSEQQLTLENRGIEAGDFRKYAAARADHFDALRRKHEQAVSEGRFTVEPDRPAP